MHFVLYIIDAVDSVKRFNGLARPVMTKDLTLKKALDSNRLDDFIRQEVARGIGPADERELLEAIKATIKPRRSEDRTSGSQDRDGSSGK